MRPLRTLLSVVVNLAMLTLSCAGSGSDWIDSAKGASWTPVPGSLAGISATVNGLAFGVHSTGLLYRGGARGWAEIPGRLAQMDAASVGYAVGVGFDGSIFQWIGNNWVALDGSAVWSTINADGDMWVIDANDQLYRRTCGTWVAQGGKLTMVSAGPTGVLWGVNRGHNVYNWDGQAWHYIPGILAKSVAISKDGLKVAAIDLDGYMFAYDPVSRQWEQLPGAEDYTFEDLAPSSRGIIALDEVDQIFELILPQ